MRIAPDLYEQMVAHARDESPNECCGMVATRGDEVVKVYRTTNVEASPFRFVIDGAEQLRVYNEIESAELDLGAIYHSHTRTEPRPSQTDINFSQAWPGVLWIIVGLAGDDVEVKTWRIDDGDVTEAELVVE
ncbi:MAG: Mov34/MPN/PAD-1 family protein [Solirubrobacteraceae bacterium]|jgi:[CysO sulfur-carrier protein]-S-L-cysteine hydrolase